MLHILVNSFLPVTTALDRSLEEIVKSTIEDRVIAYIDVVGWQKAFDTIGHDALVEIAREIADHKAAFSPARKAKLRAWEEDIEAHQGAQVEGEYYEISFSFVSDSLVISAPSTNLRALLRVAKWVCMRLLGDYGFLTRGGIAFGRFTHDMEQDIAIGKPLVEAVQIEKTTSMPRVVLSSTAQQLADGCDYAGLIYHDGERSVLNIANSSDAWIEQCRMRIAEALASGLDERKLAKWIYISNHLPKMTAEGRVSNPPLNQT